MASPSTSRLAPRSGLRCVRLSLRRGARALTLVLLPLRLFPRLQPFAVQLIPGGLFALGIPFFIRESPRWLMQRGNRDAAVKNLCFIRNLSPEDDYIINEINEIDIQAEHDRTAVGTGFWAPIRHLFSTGHLFRRMLITSGLFMLQNGTGINAINY